jgi:hypothetical protein
MCPTFEGNCKAETAAQASRQKNDDSPMYHPTPANGMKVANGVFLQGFDFHFDKTKPKTQRKTMTDNPMRRPINPGSE